MQPTLNQAAQRFAPFGARGLEPELRRADRRDITAGTGTDDKDVVVVISHLLFLYPSGDGEKSLRGRSSRVGSSIAFASRFQEDLPPRGHRSGGDVAQRQVHHRTDDLTIDRDRTILDAMEAQHGRLRQLMIGVDISEPKTPPFEMVKVPRS